MGLKHAADLSASPSIISSGSVTCAPWHDLSWRFMQIGIKPSTMVRESVDGTGNASRSTVEDMGVYHRDLCVAMAQEFLDRPDIVTAFEQVRCERMALMLRAA